MPTTIGKIPIKQPDQIIYSKNGGTSIVQEWQGPVGLMNGLIANLRVGFDEVQSSTRDGVTTVRGFNRAPIGSEQEKPTVNFDLVSESQTVGLAFNGYFSKVPAKVVTAVENAFNDSKKTRIEKDALITDAAQAAFDAGDITDLVLVTKRGKYMLTLKERGQDSFIDTTWAFTRTTTVSRYYPTTISLADHGKLWTGQDIGDYVGNIPLFSIPVKTVSQEQSLIGLDYRWLRHQTQVQLNSAGNFNLIEGWRLALWNTNTYGLK